jgi:hypothetical protein
MTVVEIERGGDWSEAEIARFAKRASIFIAEGLKESDAERLAEQMLYRDRPDSCDDRRLCFECKYLRPNVLCRPGMLPLRFVLQRCDGFEIRSVK